MSSLCRIACAAGQARVDLPATGQPMMPSPLGVSARTVAAATVHRMHVLDGQ